MREEIIRMLVASGHSQKDAEQMAQQTIHAQQTVQAGVSYGGMHAEDLGRLWNQARQSGARRLVLEVCTDQDGYHTTIKVLERDGQKHQ
ncbi:hypothetical protein [Deinococcus cellulosilyticus]|nr:hypothetical protein [Deinococcus cellulosilyticus]